MLVWNDQGIVKIVPFSRIPDITVSESKHWYGTCTFTCLLLVSILRYLSIEAIPLVIVFSHCTFSFYFHRVRLYFAQLCLRSVTQTAQYCRKLFNNHTWVTLLLWNQVSYLFLKGRQRAHPRRDDGAQSPQDRQDLPQLPPVQEHPQHHHAHTSLHGHLRRGPLRLLLLLRGHRFGGF